MSWRSLPLLHHGQLTHPGVSPPSVPEAAGHSGGPARGSPPRHRARCHCCPCRYPPGGGMRTRPRPHPLARASCPRTGRPPSRASHAVLPGITRTVNRESSDTEAVVRMRHASLRGSGSGARRPPRATADACWPHRPESARGFAEGSALPSPTPFRLASSHF